MYDVTAPKSFENLEKWRSELLTQSGPAEPAEFPFAVVGNKFDISPENRRISEKAVNNWCEAHAMIDRQPRTNGEPPGELTTIPIPHFQASAKSGDGVEEAFQAIAKAAMLKAMSEGEPSGEAFFDERYEVITDVNDEEQEKRKCC